MQFFDIQQFFSEKAGPVFFQIVGIVLFTIIAIALANKLINIFFAGLQRQARVAAYQKRLTTLESLVGNAADFILILVMLFMLLERLGLDIRPLLTGAGIAGLAISFGAQTLIKDVLAGFFIMVENQYNVGDEIEIGATAGTVRQVNLRTTKLEDKKGNTVYIPNSKIDKIVIFKKKK